MRKCCQKYTGKRGEQSMEHITSRQNALMTHIRKLSASRAYRRASGEYLCDGVKLLEEALRWNAPLKTVVLSECVDAPTLPSGVRAVRVPADVMRSISPMETPQGALFTVRLPDTALPETLSGAHYLVLDGVQDPGNVGTILRTADAFDCDGVFIVNACADPYSPKTARATMGAVFMTSPCRPGQPKLRFAPGTAFRIFLNCGRPQKNTMTARMMNGIHARMTSPKE